MNGTEVAGGGGLFWGRVAALPQTRWSVVARASDRDQEVWLEALNAVFLLYRPVFVQHLICQFRVPYDRAEDLIQEFLAEKMLRQNVLRHASSAKGRLRGFLLKMLENFVKSSWRTQQAAKRRPSDPDAKRLDDLPEMVADSKPPGEMFNEIWARQVLNMAIAHMREVCALKKFQAHWGVFEARVLLPALEGATPMPYDELVARFGLRSPNEASNLLVTAKRLFAQALVSVVQETVVDEGDVESELRELKRILAR